MQKPADYSDGEREIAGELAAARERITELEKALSADAARLDWIETECVYLLQRSLAAEIGTSRDAIDAARGALHALRIENSTLRERLLELIAEEVALRTEYATLRADTDRLEWIQNHAACVSPNLALDDDGWPAWRVQAAGESATEHDDLRACIDAARE